MSASPIPVGREPVLARRRVALLLVVTLGLPALALLGRHALAAPLEFAALASLSEHPEPAVRHFAGTATYRLRFPAPAANAAPGERVFLDLGQVECIARVTLNGRDLGVLWHPPFRIEITDTLRPGENELAIAVSTTWHNRLVGDEREPADFEWGKDRGPTMGRALGAYPEWFLKNQPRPSTGRKAFVTWFYHREDTPLRPSGLLGPVTLNRHPAPKN